MAHSRDVDDEEGQAMTGSRRRCMASCWTAVTADFRPLGLSRWYWLKRWLHYLIHGDSEAPL